MDKINKSFGTSYNLIGLFRIILWTLAKTVSSLKNMSGETITKTFEFASSVLDVVLDFVIAFYILCDSIRLINSITKSLYK